jgi:hypothetical protein
MPRHESVTDEYVDEWSSRPRYPRCAYWPDRLTRAFPGRLLQGANQGPLQSPCKQRALDLALEQLMTLGLINSETSGKRGRPATLWAKVEDPKVVGPETYGA